MAQRRRLSETRRRETIRGWMVARQPAVTQADVFYLSLVSVQGGGSTGWIRYEFEGKVMMHGGVHTCGLYMYANVHLWLGTVSHGA